MGAPTLKTHYWLIAYVWRRAGNADWSHANEAFKGTLSEWFKEQQQYEQEFYLTNAIPIDKKQYDWLKENV
jgi:hypothetical protein